MSTTCPRCGRTFDDGVRFCPVDGTLVTPAVEDRNIGQILLGQFEVRDVCGRGAMGSVYRAYQRTMDRVVAVKILRRELLKEPEVVRRFLREARAAAKLQHPNIVTVHLVGETDDGVPFLVMEHVDGVSLEMICEAQGAQPVQRTVALGRQIGSALAEAHAAGIIHRDLKPANILVTDRSRTPDQVKVLDFGIAKIVHGADQSIVTRDGVIFGTPHYIAPEQAAGGEIDHRADLYSLGVVLFRLSTGRLPFEGSQGMQVVLKHLREAPPRPRQLAPELPSALEQLILSCLAKDRTQRPADAEAVIAELDRVLQPNAKGTLLGVSAPEPLRPAAISHPDAKTIRPPDRARPSPATTGRIVPPAAMRDRTEAIVPPRWWHGRGLLIGGVLAIALGVAVGVGAALWGNRAASTTSALPPAPVVAATMGEPVVTPLPPSPPPAPPVVLIDEHVLSEEGVTLRAGFEAAPEAGAPARLAVLLSDGKRTLDGADVQIEMRPPAGAGTRLRARAEGDRYQAELPFGAGGRFRLRVEATPRSSGRTIVLAFDVDAPGTKAEARSAHRTRAPKPEKDDDLPVTVIAPDHAPDPPPPPRRLAGSPRPARADDDLPPASEDRPPPPSADPTTVPLPTENR